MGGKYKDITSPDQFQMMDPGQRFEGAYNAFSNQYGQLSRDPNAYMNQFMGQSAGLAGIAQDATSPLGASLSDIAGRNARLGGEAALAAMGGRNTGAGQAAFGQAYGDEFAKAAAQTQAAQLGLTGSLWNQAMGANAANYQTALGLAGQGLNSLAGQNAMWYQPNMVYQPGAWDRIMQAATVASGFFPGGGGGASAFGGGSSSYSGGRNVQ